MGNTILVVEGDKARAENIRSYLEHNQWETHICHSAEQALKMLESVRPEVLLVAHTLPLKSGLELLGTVAQSSPRIKVVMMDGQCKPPSGVDGIDMQGEHDLMKSLNLPELRHWLNEASGVRCMKRAWHIDPRTHQASMVGTSTPMTAMKRTLVQLLEAERRMAHDDLPAVLITGETGTGKELVARALHFDGSRSAAPFIEVNCASIPSHLLEAELFGHEKGAFTDAKDRKLGLAEAADGGTLFLDEVGEIEPSLQGKLLKLLEEKTIRRIGSVREKKVNIRIIAATNQDLEKRVAEGRFRADLYFRLRIITIRVPPLRERGSDILLLARHYLDVHGARYGKPALFFSPDAERRLLHHRWPGNVRELRNMLEQTVMLASSPMITASDLEKFRSFMPEPGADRQEEHGDTGDPNPLPGPKATGLKRLSDLERDLVLETLGKTDWNVSKTARLLGLSRDKLRHLIEKLGLARPVESPLR